MDILYSSIFWISLSAILLFSLGYKQGYYVGKKEGEREGETKSATKGIKALLFQQMKYSKVIHDDYKGKVKGYTEALAELEKASQK